MEKSRENGDYLPALAFWDVDIINGIDYPWSRSCIHIIPEQSHQTRIANCFRYRIIKCTLSISSSLCPIRQGQHRTKCWKKTVIFGFGKNIWVFLNGIRTNSRLGRLNIGISIKSKEFRKSDKYHDWESVSPLQ